MSRERRIVITGVGPICALGVGVDPLWQALCEGRSAIRRISRFDPSGFSCQVAAELPDELFDVKSIVPKSYRKATKVMARDIELAVGAAAAALADARLSTKAVDPEAAPTIPPARFGCHIGAGLIAADIDELTAALITSAAARPGGVGALSAESGALADRFDPAGARSGAVAQLAAAPARHAAKPSRVPIDLAHWGHTGMNQLTPLWLLKYLPNMLACHVTIIHDCQGPSNTITCAEASSLLSIGESMRVIERGAADACLSGGAEAKINPMGLLRQTFAKRLMESDGELHGRGVAPFDAAANGTVLGEGGGLVVLEELTVAQRRGAAVYAELLSFAATQSHCPDTVGLQIDDGESIADAVEAALEAAKISPRAIDAIVPFGSGIAHIDRAEAAAIARVFGSGAAEIPLVTTVPAVGNCCAGSGAISVIAAAMALKRQVLPARMNTTAPIAPLGANAAAAKARQADLNHVLITSTGMGGQNAAVVMKRMTDAA